MSGDGADTGSTGIQAVVGSGRGGCGGKADRRLGGGTDGGGGGYGRDGDGGRLSRWEDNIENLTLRTEPNSPLDYALGLEHHHLIMGTLGEPGVWLER